VQVASCRGRVQLAAMEALIGLQALLEVTPYVAAAVLSVVISVLVVFAVALQMLPKPQMVRLDV
jgi:hypothetical protein